MNASMVYESAEHIASLAAILSVVSDGAQDSDMSRALTFISDGLKDDVDALYSAAHEDTEAADAATK
ncbi:MAG: hypothetical protein LUH03_09710 [Oscillospiraceae bacterium]|nr:hypothetical protein [Oscillospiraceae bacterium]